MPAVNCPNCRVKLTLPANFSGTGSLRCPKCATVFKPADHMEAPASVAPAPVKAAPDPEPTPAAGGGAFDFGLDDPLPPPKAKSRPAVKPLPEPEEESAPAPARGAKKGKEPPPARSRYGKAAADTGKKFPTKWVAIGGGAVLVLGIGIAVVLSGGSKPTAEKGKEKDKPTVADKGKDRGKDRTTGKDRTEPQPVSNPNTVLPGVEELFRAGVAVAAPPKTPPVPMLQRTGNTQLAIPGFKDDAPAPDPAAGKLTRDEVKKATVFIKSMEESGRGGTGTGFVIRADGDTALVATNQHVVGTKLVADPKVKVSVVFNSGTRKEEQEVRAEIIALDPVADLAVLRVGGVKAMPKPLDPRHSPKPTETLEVFAYGYPLGSQIGRAEGRTGNPEITIVKGAVSRLILKESGDMDKVQMDINLNPGNSGGPIVDTDGRLVGVAVSKIVAEAVNNIAFAVPVPELTGLLAGKVLEPRFAPGKKDGDATAFDVTLPVSDPFGQLKAVTLYYKAGEESGLGDDGKAAVMPGATQYDAKLTGAKEVVTTVRLPVAEGDHVLFQLACTHANGQTGITRPVKFKVAMGRPPTTTGDATPLAEVDANPEKFEGQEVTVNGRLGGEAGRYRPGILELDLLYERSGEKPLNLMGVVAPDVAEQLKDMPDGSSFISAFFTPRITLRVGKKGSGERGLTPVRVVRIEYLNPFNGSVVTVPSNDLADEFPLIGLNREPDKSVGKSLTFEAIVYGVHPGEKEVELTVHTMLDRKPENLHFITTREVAARIRGAGEGSRSGAVMVTLTATVENRKVQGKRVVMVTGVEASRGPSRRKK